MPTVRSAATYLLALCTWAPPAVAMAATADVLPFTPPLNWTRIASAPGISWSARNGSTFNVGRSGSLTSEAAFERVVAAQTGPGSPASVTKLQVCGSSAVRLEQHVTAGPAGAIDAIVQLQYLDGSVYSLAYTKPDSLVSDPAIVALMDSFCGERSVASAKPPDGWKTGGPQALGTWVTGSVVETMTLTSAPLPRDGSLQASFDAITSLGGAMEIVSKSMSTLCGKPAYVVVTRSEHGGRKYLSTVELTANDATLYSLVYQRPEFVASDDAAHASLASLCAPGAAAPATDSPSPVASATP